MTNLRKTIGFRPKPWNTSATAHIVYFCQKDLWGIGCAHGQGRNTKGKEKAPN